MDGVNGKLPQFPQVIIGFHWSDAAAVVKHKTTNWKEEKKTMTWT